jgi:hypothetical protein
MGTYYRITEKASQGIRIQPNFKYTYDDAFFKTEIFENQTFSIYKGKRIMDIVGLNSIGTFAISERLKLFLEEHKIKGWTSYQIKINNVDKNYFIFKVIGKAGPITNRDKFGMSQSGNIRFDCESIDGSDIFYLEGTRLIACNEQTKHLLEKGKFSNLDIRPLIAV